MNKIRVWPYIIIFVFFTIVPMMSLISIDLKHIVAILVFGGVGAFIGGSIINIIINCLTKQ